MLHRFLRPFAFSIALCICAQPALAQTETSITVYVTTESNRPLGEISGESLVVVRERASGDVIASGQSYKGKFDVSLDLVRPTETTISATGPLAGINTVTVSKDILLIPGKDYSVNNGIGMTLPGIAVDLLTPEPDKTSPAGYADDVLVTAYVSELDGQPASGETFEVDATVYRGSVILGTTRMVKTKEPGRFAGKLKFPNPGPYNIVVTAYDPAGKSAGMDQRMYIVSASPASAPESKAD